MENLTPLINDLQTGMFAIYYCIGVLCLIIIIETAVILWLSRRLERK